MATLLADELLSYNPETPMPITRSDVEKIAELARLELTPEETELFTTQLSSIIEHV